VSSLYSRSTTDVGLLDPEPDVRDKLPRGSWPRGLPTVPTTVNGASFGMTIAEWAPCPSNYSFIDIGV
jgi:hypothetical protein